MKVKDFVNVRNDANIVVLNYDETIMYAESLVSDEIVNAIAKDTTEIIIVDDFPLEAMEAEVYAIDIYENTFIVMVRA